MTMGSAPSKASHASPGLPLPNSVMTFVLCPRHVRLLAAHHGAKANSQCIWNKGWQSFPIKDQMVNFISFAGHACVRADLLQSCLTLCNPLDYNPPGSSVHGILQARILEWVAVPFSRGSRIELADWTRVSYVSCTGRFLTTSARGKP